MNNGAIAEQRKILTDLRERARTVISTVLGRVEEREPAGAPSMRMEAALGVLQERALAVLDVIDLRIEEATSSAQSEDVDLEWAEAVQEARYTCRWVAKQVREILNELRHADGYLHRLGAMTRAQESLVFGLKAAIDAIEKLEAETPVDLADDEMAVA